MTEKRAHILFISGMVLLEVFLLKGMKSLGASSEELVLAYILLLVAGSFGVGQIVLRYRR
jgi:hypothetical protein